MRIVSFLFGGGVILMLVLSAPAFADTVYNNQADFYAAAGSLSVKDFEDETPWAHPDDAGVGQMVFEDFTATSDPDALKILAVPWYGNHNMTPGGSQYLSADTDIGGVGSDVVIVFDYPITEFGLWITDNEYSGGSVTVHGIANPVPAGPDGCEHYFGIISDVPFTTVSLYMGNDSQWSMDDVAYTPELCFGDLDGDGDVDLADLAQLLSNYGMTSGAVYEDGDLDEDGDVDLADLAALLSVYGTVCD